MAVILLAGGDEPMLEGLAQTLTAAGHRPVLAATAAEAVARAREEAPLVAILDRALVQADGELQSLRLRPGGACIVYRGPGLPREPLPRALQRLTLAEVALPLERHRVVALVESVVARARAAGRDNDRGAPSAESRP